MAFFSDLTLQIPNSDFQDFDDRANYDKFEKAFLNIETLNCVLDFDDATARAALDLGYDELRKLLNSERQDSRTRWINIWASEKQAPAVKAIATHYGFSRRLLGLMCDIPTKAKSNPTIQSPRNRVQEFIHLHKLGDRSSVKESFDDEARLEMAQMTNVSMGTLDLSHYRLINEVWHYASVDWGRRYLCVGYNSLFNTPTSLAERTPHAIRSDNQPQGRRLWTWLILCDDGTIVTIHENPFPDRQGPLNTQQQLDLRVIRQNTLNIFRQLSRVNEGAKDQAAIMAIGVRGSGSGTAGTEAHVTNEDSPSLLFYYIFDDWCTTYSLVARQQHRYGAELEQLRKQMFDRPELAHIDWLHHVGRQLAILKRIYQSYESIIERVLVKQKSVNFSIASHPQNSLDYLRKGAPSQEERRMTGSASNVTAADPTTDGVVLAKAALSRFERLKDRISLYALSEIQECLDEKESLMILNYNLIAIKESQAVERLTRITILLAKFTILFLPVSLMTAYFSVQIPDLQIGYTAATYWVTFTVIIVITFGFLVVFGKLSGTVEGKPIYRSLTQTFFDRSMVAMGRKPRRS